MVGGGPSFRLTADVDVLRSRITLQDNYIYYVFNNLKLCPVRSSLAIPLYVEIGRLADAPSESLTSPH